MAATVCICRKPHHVFFFFCFQFLLFQKQENPQEVAQIMRMESYKITAIYLLKNKFMCRCHYILASIKQTTTSETVSSPEYHGPFVLFCEVDTIICVSPHFTYPLITLSFSVLILYIWEHNCVQEQFYIHSNFCAFQSGWRIKIVMIIVIIMKS